MNDPYPIVPSDGPIPVTARRPFSSVPAESQANPATSAGVPMAPAPQVIYINTVAPPAQPMTQYAPPSAPPVVAPVEHHYTTHHYNYGTARAPSNSALGMVSLALGIIGLLICWIPFAGLAAVPIGAIGAVIGLLGVCVSILFRRSSAGLPFTGVFICCLAAGISIASTKSLPYWTTQLKKAFPILAEHSTPGSPSRIRPLASPDAQSSPSNIFDSAPTAAPAPTPAKIPAVIKQSAPPTPVAAPPKIDPTITAAIDRLMAAESASQARAMKTVEYQDALKAAANARAHVAALRQSAPGSSELKDASQAMIDADNAVSAVVSAAIAVDPDVSLARSNLAAAKDKSSGRP